MPIGIALPFSLATGSLGYFNVTNTELEAVKSNLRSLLVTNWGERVMHYQLGCNLIEFLFENDSSPELKERISDRIISQVQKWMPFVSVDNIQITVSDEDSSLPEHAIRIEIQFHLNNKPDLAALFDVVVLRP